MRSALSLDSKLFAIGWAYCNARANRKIKVISRSSEAIWKLGVVS